MATATMADPGALALSQLLSDLRVGEPRAAEAAPMEPLAARAPFFRYPNGERQGIYSGAWIPRDALLGELEGTPRDVYEMHHDEYLLLTETCVLDLRADPARPCGEDRPLLAWVTEDNETFAPVNCRVLRAVRANRFYLQAVRDIAPDEQIVYSMQLYGEYWDGDE